MMRILKITVVSIALVTTQSLGARPPAPKPLPPPPPATFVLNQNSLQSQLLSNNLDLIKALYAVHDAKDQVNIARANLLPSLNLGSLLNLTGGGFILSSINFLLPFLVPSNWYNYAAEKNLFQAEKIAYHAIQLNAYSSALALYFTLVADRQIQAIYQQQYHDLQDIFEMQKKRSTVGLVPISDLMQIQAQARMAGVKASQLAELNKQEIAAIRKFMSLPLETQIRLENSTMANSPWEFENMQATIDRANTVSVERAQIQYLIKAAQAQKWSKVFSIVNSPSIVGGSVGGHNANFDNMQAVGSMSFGFAQFPTYELNERRIKEIKLQDLELQEENTRIVEATIGSIEEARQQLDLATQAEVQMAQVYEIRRQDYEQGGGTLIDVLQARNQMADASVARIKALLDVNLQRNTLHRTLLTASFSTIRGCNAARTPPVERKVGVIGRIVGKKPVESHQTLDRICRGG